MKVTRRRAVWTSLVASETACSASRYFLRARKKSSSALLKEAVFPSMVLQAALGATAVLLLLVAALALVLAQARGVKMHAGVATEAMREDTMKRLNIDILEG